MKIRTNIIILILFGACSVALSDICNIESHATNGQIAPSTNGGTFNLLASLNPTAVNSSGWIAFNSPVDGSDRNQGVFVADENGTISAIAIGCGGSGGGGDTTSSCGDVSPIGGHFGGFFSNNADLAPDMNDSGDVLFMCDVNGGSALRALFLYRAISGQIIKIAAIGDPSPIGGTFGAVGPGTLNNSGGVVFLASAVGTTTSDIFTWRNGVITKVDAVGDPSPGGGTYTSLGTGGLTFIDGTTIPVSPLPDINDVNQIAFVAGATNKSGIILRTGTTDHWDIRVGDLTPVGGRFTAMQSPSLNNVGQIAFSADYQLGPHMSNSGIFAGATGNWRKVIAFLDPIDGGQCLGLAFSSTPMQSIDNSGNVVFWTDLSGNETQDRIVLGLTTGEFLIVARLGDPTPLGGTYGLMNAHPSIDGTTGTLNVAIDGGPTSFAQMVFSNCP